MNLQRVARATLEVPASDIDLESWLFGLSDAEYQACARGHHGAGVFNDERGRGMVNVGPRLIFEPDPTEAARPSSIQTSSDSQGVEPTPGGALSASRRAARDVMPSLGKIR